MHTQTDKLSISKTRYLTLTVQRENSYLSAEEGLVVSYHFHFLNITLWTWLGGQSFAVGLDGRWFDPCMEAISKSKSEATVKQPELYVNVKLSECDTDPFNRVLRELLEHCLETIFYWIQTGSTHSSTASPDLPPHRDLPDYSHGSTSGSTHSSTTSPDLPPHRSTGLLSRPLPQVSTPLYRLT